MESQQKTIGITLYQKKCKKHTHR